MNKLFCKRNIDRTFIHCSAFDDPAHDDIKIIRQWHVVGNQWSDVGYHFYIRKNGKVQAGRPLDRDPAAQKGHNKNTIAICIGGLANFTIPQIAALRNLCSTIQSIYPECTFHGHCEVSSKTCPVIDYKAILELDAEGHTNV